MTLNGGENGFNSPQKLKPEAGRLVVVPNERVRKICLRSGLEPEAAHLAEAV